MAGSLFFVRASVSRILSSILLSQNRATVIYLGFILLRTSSGRTALHRIGVCTGCHLWQSRVSSYLTISPLLLPLGRLAVCFCCDLNRISAIKVLCLAAKLSVGLGDNFSRERRNHSLLPAAVSGYHLPYALRHKGCSDFPNQFKLMN